MLGGSVLQAHIVVKHGIAASSARRVSVALHGREQLHIAVYTGKAITLGCACHRRQPHPHLALAPMRQQPGEEEVSGQEDDEALRLLV